MEQRYRIWLDNATRCGGSFVGNFAKACLSADEDNLLILFPALLQIAAKYPKYFEENLYGRKDVSSSS